LSPPTNLIISRELSTVCWDFLWGTW